METLVVVAQHRNQYYSGRKSNGPARFSSSPSKYFREINCRSFQSGSGILPTPFKFSSSPEINQAPPSPLLTPLDPSSVSNEATNLKKKAQSTPIAIKAKSTNDERFFYNEFVDGSLPLSELWAGPAYSNSPPPSSLPIPKFSLRQKRTVSLDLPHSASEDIVVLSTTKSAPASPTRDCKPSTKVFFNSADSATRTLRRILNLDVADE